jgi:hypothetical protein
LDLYFLLCWISILHSLLSAQGKEIWISDITSMYAVAPLGPLADLASYLCFKMFRPIKR